jgi:hypothetical protein
MKITPTQNPWSPVELSGEEKRMPISSRMEIVADADFGAVIGFPHDGQPPHLWCACCLEQEEINGIITATKELGIKTLLWNRKKDDWCPMISLMEEHGITWHNLSGDPGE